MSASENSNTDVKFVTLDGIAIDMERDYGVSDRKLIQAATDELEKQNKIATLPLYWQTVEETPLLTGRKLRSVAPRYLLQLADVAQWQYERTQYSHRCRRQPTGRPREHRYFYLPRKSFPRQLVFGLYSLATFTSSL